MMASGAMRSVVGLATEVVVRGRGRGETQKFHCKGKAHCRRQTDFGPRLWSACGLSLVIHRGLS